MLNAALEGEMDAHMSDQERSSGNRRNGYTDKQVLSPVGELSIQTPRDRDASFDPVLVKKRERILADGLSDRILELYALGTISREISSLLEEQFGNRISPETISAVTDRILPELQAWRNRPLDAVYPIVWLDAIHYKVITAIS